MSERNLTKEDEQVRRFVAVPRWTDSEGQEAVVYNGHLSIYGKPSMTRDDGVVAIGIDLSPVFVEVMDEHLRKAAVREFAQVLYRRQADLYIAGVSEAGRLMALQDLLREAGGADV